MKNLPSAVFMLVIIASLPVSAQFGFVPYDGVPQDVGGSGEALTDIDFARFPGMARCMCDEAGFDPTLYLAVYYDGQLEDTDVYFYLGNDCDSDAVAIDEQCHQLAVINLSDFNRTQVLEIPINYLVDPQEGVCSEYDSGSSTVYAFVGDKNGAATATYAITYDTKAPGPPEEVAAVPGEDGVSISWSPPESGGQEVDYYAVLCMTIDGSPVDGVSDEAPWNDTVGICGAEITVDGTSVTASTSVERCPEGGVQEGAQPSSCHVCAVVTGTSNSVRISGLENGRGYVFGVVAVDDMLNASVISATVSATPEPTTDFAEHYRQSGGSASGDYCFVATAVFGDIDSPPVKVLRMFRDRYLLTNGPGRTFVAWYYANGRSWARWVEGNTFMRIAAAIPLILVTPFVAILLVLGLWGTALLLFSAVYFLRTRRISR